MDSRFADVTMKTQEALLSFFGFNEYESGSEAKDDYQTFMKKVILIHGVMLDYEVNLIQYNYLKIEFFK